MGYALTSKSQVTLPKAIRELLGVSPGQEIDYEALPDGRVVIFPGSHGQSVYATARCWIAPPTHR